MIIYGARSTKTGHHDLFGTKCSHCGNANTLELYTFSRYAHIFWIPLFPFKKDAVTQCNHCKQILSKKEFNAELLDKYNEVKANTKTPYWQFAGLVLIALGIVAGVYGEAQNNKEDNSFLTAPKSGDVYQVKTFGGNYTLYKVASVTPDSVYVMPNQYEVNKISGLRKSDMTDPANFITDESELLAFSIKDLAKKKEAGEILRVIRK
jgi:hypothetical protein